MEIPTGVINRLQSSLRGAAGAPTFSDAAPPVPPFPSVADAVAAFDAGASTSDSAELRCSRCGAAGGFLRGARSALCAYCGSPRRGEGGECEGGGVAFRHGPSYQWLLGSLGLDGSVSSLLLPHFCARASKFDYLIRDVSELGRCTGNIAS
jgi:hypothetical protein